MRLMQGKKEWIVQHESDAVDEMRVNFKAALCSNASMQNVIIIPNSPKLQCETKTPEMVYIMKAKWSYRPFESVLLDFLFIESLISPARTSM